MNKENQFLQIITYAPIIFIPLIIGTVFVILLNTYSTNLEKIETNLYQAKKEGLETKINNMGEIITYYTSVVKDELKIRVKNRVQHAHDIALTIYNENKNIKSQDAIKKEIKTALKALLWNNNESFIWIINYQGIFELAPYYLKSLEGSSIIEFQDTTGRYIIKEEINLAKNKQEGYLWDTFTKPNENNNIQYEQVAFVKSFGHFNWYFGSAEYLETARKESTKKLLHIVKKIDKLNHNKTIIIDIKNHILLSSFSQTMTSIPISSIQNRPLKKILQNVIEYMQTKNKLSLTYKHEKKYLFFKKIPHTNLIIGSKFNLKEIKDELASHNVDMYDILYSKSDNILYVALFATIISLFLAYLLAYKLKRIFIHYKEDIIFEQIKLKKLNETLEEKVIQRTQALEKMKNKFQVLATIDSLTKLHNRYSLMKNLKENIKFSQSNTLPLSVILLDIDFFKKVNDTYGHLIGDKVLISLSKIIKKALKEEYIAGRYGGEEFLIILPYSNLKDASSFANFLHKEVEGYHFNTVGQVTISLGVAQLHNNEDIDTLFQKVDNLLYQSKNNGRNCVTTQTIN